MKLRGFSPATKFVARANVKSPSWGSFLSARGKMSVGKLIQFFSTFTKLPIYAEQVRDQIVDLGIQDEIHFQPIDVPSERLLGMFVRGRRRNRPYSDHENISTIFYNLNVDPDEQNFICIKELMHVFDSNIEGASSNSREFCDHVGYLFSDKANRPEVTTLSGIVDSIASYMACAVMFPHELRDEFIAAHKSRQMSEEDIAKELGISPKYVGQLLLPEWDTVRNVLMRF